VIIHGKTGLLCEEHDVGTMSENMLKLLDDIDFAKQLGASGKQHILEHFSMARHIGVLQETLKAVAKVC
jgi:glycosyltransferase involved in cell wall biosynthesis